MTEVNPDELKRAVESLHGGTATLVQSVPVTEIMKHRAERGGAIFITDKTVWDGVVHVFDLQGHPKAKRAYAWSSPIDSIERAAGGRLAANLTAKSFLSERSSHSAKLGHYRFLSVR